MLNWPIEKSKLWALSKGNYNLSPKYKNTKVIHNHGFWWLITAMDKQKDLLKSHSSHFAGFIMDCKSQAAEEERHVDNEPTQQHV